MIGLLIAISAFNYLSFKNNKRLTGNQIVHIWVFTIAFQSLFDIIVEFKYHGYWYFDKMIDWAGLLPHMLLVPPVNMIFLIWFPYHSKVIMKFFYITFLLLVF
jgi:hypothetical protein